MVSSENSDYRELIMMIVDRSRSNWEEVREHLITTTGWRSNFPNVLYCIACRSQCPEDIVLCATSLVDADGLMDDQYRVSCLGEQILAVEHYSVNVTRAILRSVSDGYKNESDFHVDNIATKAKIRQVIDTLWRDFVEFKLDDWNHLTKLRDLRGSTDANIQKFIALWDKTELLVKFLNKDLDIDMPAEEVPLVHTMIYLGLPKVLVWIAMQLCPEQATFKDKYGRIPLHVAAIYNNLKTKPDDAETAGRRYESTEEALFDKPEEHPKIKLIKDWSMVEVVLNASSSQEANADNPLATTVRDNEGMLPFDFLLDQEYRGVKMMKGPVHRVFHEYNSADKSFPGTLQAILALAGANLELLTRPHPRHKDMLPFMMTAACERNAMKELSKKERESALQRKVKLTHAVLSLNPSVLLSGIQGEKEVPPLRKSYRAKRDAASTTIMGGQELLAKRRRQKK